MSVHSRIQNHAMEIVRLHRQMHAAVAERHRGPRELAQWQAACTEFHSRYEELAFPGGPRTARDQLRAGNPEAIEYALAFLEVRPYFFRSGYMFKDLIRVVRHCELTPDQRARYDVVRQEYDHFRELRRQSRGRTV